MNTPAPHTQDINHFFEKYASALENHDTKSMAYLYHTPCTLVSDDVDTFFNDPSKLEGFFNQGMTFYRQFGIARVLHEVWSRREWTGRIMNVKVNWRYLTHDHQPVYNCDYHYVLKLDKNNQWKIILSASLNERERMEAWQHNKQKS